MEDHLPLHEFWFPVLTSGFILLTKDSCLFSFLYLSTLSKNGALSSSFLVFVGREVEDMVPLFVGLMVEEGKYVEVVLLFVGIMTVVERRKVVITGWWG